MRGDTAAAQKRKRGEVQECSKAGGRERARDEGGAVTGLGIGAAVEVHKAPGPGLLESVYEECPVHELRLRGAHVRRQVPLDLDYKGLRVGAAYRMDAVVERTVVVEVKTVERFHPLHQAQLLT